MAFDFLYFLLARECGVLIQVLVLNEKCDCSVFFCLQIVVELVGVIYLFLFFLVLLYMYLFYWVNNNLFDIIYATAQSCELERKGN